MTTWLLVPITRKGRQRSGSKAGQWVDVLRTDRPACFDGEVGLFVRFPNGHERWIRTDGGPEFRRLGSAEP